MRSCCTRHWILRWGFLASVVLICIALCSARESLAESIHVSSTASEPCLSCALMNAKLVTSARASVRGFQELSSIACTGIGNRTRKRGCVGFILVGGDGPIRIRAILC